MWRQANSNAYSAAKAAVANFTRSAALSYARDGIRFNAVSPGYVDTPLLAQLPDETRSQMLSRQPIGRLLRPEEIADVVLFLASDSLLRTDGIHYQCRRRIHVHLKSNRSVAAPGPRLTQRAYFCLRVWVAE